MYNTVTLTGHIGSEPILKTSKNGHPFVCFRLGCTPRVKREGRWTDDGTIWFSVYAWNSLAQNCFESLRKGDRVVLHGNMRVQSWVGNDGIARETKVVDALALGPDLTFDIAPVQRRRDVMGAVCEELVDPETGEVLPPDDETDGPLPEPDLILSTDEEVLAS